MNKLAVLTTRMAFAAITCIAISSTAFAQRKNEPVKTSVTITTDPPGASVTINRIPIGTTPHACLLEPGKHLLKLELRDFESEFRTIAVGSTPVVENIPLTPITSTVLILSTPPGATISRDGANAGITPLLIPELPIGKYRIDITLSGYKSQQQELNISGSAPQRIKAELVSSSATLSVDSTPSEASVSVNGIFRGTTPIKIDKIQEGQSSLEVTAAGYAPYKEQVQLAAGEVFSVHVPLQALPSKLAIQSIPDGARVYIDNEFKGETPLGSQALPAGTYRIRVEKPGHETMARTITLGNEQELTEEFRMTANVGGVRIITSPADVSIFINGKEVGKTVAPADATDQISVPLDIPNMAIGLTEILFQRSGYAEEKRSVEIIRDETAVVETVKLSRLFVPNIEVKTEIGTYTGVYVSKDKEFYRVETSPGVTRSFPIKDISRIRLIRDGNIVEDLTE